MMKSYYSEWLRYKAVEIPYLHSLALTIHLSCNNEAHSMLLAWLSAQPFFKKVNSSLVTVDMKKACAPTSHSPTKKPLQYALWNGEFWFLYKGQWIVFRRIKKNNNDVFARETEEVSLQCFR